MYPGWESNPHARRHTILSRARLPIPPPRHFRSMLPTEAIIETGCEYNTDLVVAQNPFFHFLLFLAIFDGFCLPATQNDASARLCATPTGQQQ